MQVHVINHPIKLGAKIHANRPSCPCKGAKLIPVTGTVGKVIHNHTGYWYYLTDVGVTIKGEWIEAVIA